MHIIGLIATSQLNVNIFTGGSAIYDVMYLTNKDFLHFFYILHFYIFKVILYVL